MSEEIRAFLSSPTAKLPSKAHPTDTGYDLFVDHECLVTEVPHAYPTGIKLLIPPGYWVKFLEKSGKALKGLSIHGGVIDTSYCGELKVIATAYPPLRLLAGEAICQFSLEKLNSAYLTEISEEEFLKGLALSERKDAGFGSTGR